MGPRIDLFCRVIDNLGDIGVSWRLARQLSSEYDCRVRLWVDRLESLARLEPNVDPTAGAQSCDSIQIRHWADESALLAQLDGPPDMVIAAFSCDLPESYLECLRQHPQTAWYQLDYLSAQTWVDDFHLQHSPRSDGLTPVFFFPGFTRKTGGLIRETALTHQLRDKAHTARTIDAAWLQSLGLSTSDLEKRLLVSVFTYAHAPIDTLVQTLEALQQDTLFLLPQGVKSRLHDMSPGEFRHVKWQTIPFLRQPGYDRLLANMDLNLVRGEDSFVRAIWAGKPFIWHIYPQDEREHHRKLQAWLDIAGLPAEVAHVMHAWSEGQLDATTARILSGDLWHAWQRCSLAHRQMLLDQPDLASRLISHWEQHFAKNRP